jgi:hypothetical protein
MMNSVRWSALTIGRDGADEAHVRGGSSHDLPWPSRVARDLAGRGGVVHEGGHGSLPTTYS